MPTYTTTDPQTGLKIKLAGDSPPSESDIDQAFAAVRANGARGPWDDYKPQNGPWDDYKPGSRSLPPGYTLDKPSTALPPGYTLDAPTHTINVQAEDGSIHKFPMGTPPAVMEDAVNQYTASHSPSLGQSIGQYLGGIKQGIYDIPQSIAELGARGTDALGITNGGYDKLHGFLTDMNRIANPGGFDNKYGQGGRIVGQFAATAPLTELAPFKAAGPVMGALARIGNGALQGSAAAALTSNASDIPLAQQIGTGAALGSALPVLGGAARLAGNTAAEILGHITTGAGANAVRGAVDAGVAGGDAGQAFLSNMRGNTPWDSVVDQAKSALANMRLQRGAAYRSGMADVSKDQSILSFDPIDKALADANNVKTFKGQDLSPETAAVRAKIASAIDNWKSLDPAEYHTPEGFDALKQQVGDIKDAQPFGSPQRAVANTVYGAIRSTIADQAPTYDKVMAGYSNASDQLATLQKELSLGPKGNPNAALRKLQSIMRDNSNGQRAVYGNQLADAGASTLMPSLAGQAMSPMLPRGLSRFADAAAAGAGVMAHNPIALVAAPLMSPRLVGEGAYAAGAGARHVMNGVNSIPALANILRNMSTLSAPSLGLLGGQFGASLTPSLAR